jgi:hypothetical protein
MAPSQRASSRTYTSFSVVRLVAICFIVLAATFTAQAQQCVGSSAATCAYVTDYNAREIFKAEYATGSSVATLTKLYTFSGNTDRPEDLTVGPNGDLYVAITGASKIVQLRFGTNGLSQVASKNTAAKPTGLRFSWDGALYFNSTSGVWKMAGNSLTKVAAAQGTVTSPGGIAFLANGDLVFAADGTVYKAAASSGIVQPVVTGSAILQFSENVVGLASDDIDNIYVAHGNLVGRYSPPVSPNTQWTSASEWTFDTLDLPQHIEAVPDAVNGANCNTINDLVWVSSYQLSSSGSPINGKVWRLSHTQPTNSPGLACEADTSKLNTSVAIPSKVSGKFAPAIGMGVGASKRKLTKLYPNAFSTDPHAHTFNFGGFAHQLKNEFVAAGCASNSTASVIAEQMSPATLASIFAASSPQINATPVALFGQQGWITTFKLEKPACFAPESDHFITGYFTAQVPNMVDIVNDATASFAPLLGFYPTPTPLSNGAGDPGVWNKRSDRLALVTQNLNATYHVCKFLSPLRDPVADPNDPVENIFNSGQNITFKFQLSKNANCANLISDQEAESVLTVFSIGKIGATSFERQLDVDPSGNSIKVPPRFKYDARANQFLFTLDSGALDTVTGKTLFEATVSSDSTSGFAPHSVRFYVQP